MEETMKTYVTYKDRLFRMIFREKEALLKLYNAMNNTAYDQAEDLEVSTLENAIYLHMKNDVSFILYDQLTLYEQQSTDNPNMPLRDLFYISSTYSSLTRNENIYGSKLVKIPEPKFVTFYNGREEIPERSVLKLSDAYRQRSGEPELELEVKVVNINRGKNEELLRQCKALSDYMAFVEKVRSYQREISLDAAVERAIDECIHEDIMADFLRKNRAEVRSVSIFEYDEERHLQMERAAARADGFEEGQEAGRKESREEAIRILIETCESFGISEESIFGSLKEKFLLSEDVAREAMEKYSRTNDKIS